MVGEVGIVPFTWVDGFWTKLIPPPPLPPAVLAHARAHADAHAHHHRRRRRRRRRRMRARGDTSFGLLSALDTLAPQAVGAGRSRELGTLAIRGFVVSLSAMVPVGAGP